MIEIIQQMKKHLKHSSDKPFKSIININVLIKKEKQTNS